MDITTFLYQLPVLSALVSALTEFIGNKIIGKFVNVGGWGARLLSWGVSIAIVMFSSNIPLMVSFAEVGFGLKLFYGLVIGWVANGFFTIEEFKALLAKLGIR